MEDRIESLTASERWFADAQRVAAPPGGYVQRTVDMTEATKWLRSLRSVGIEAAFPHLLVHAAATALARNPDLHRTICGYERRMPGRVDIGFAMTGAKMRPPVVLEGADQKPLGQLVPAMDEALVAASRDEEAARDKARRWSAVAPLGFLRRWVLRLVRGTPWFRRRVLGTFQVSFSPGADVLVPLRLHTGAVLGAGRIRDAVVAVQGRFEVRPVVSLAVVVDHCVSDGVRASKLLNEIAAVLEEGGPNAGPADARLPS